MSYAIIPETCNGNGACKKICPTNAITGTPKKTHTIDPALCIECGACGNVCPSKAVKDSQGMICAMVKKSAWEKPQVDAMKCISCNICIEACPTFCLAPSDVMGINKHVHPYIINDKACIGCGFCALECPVDAISMSAFAPGKTAEKA